MYAFYQHLDYLNMHRLRTLLRNTIYAIEGVNRISVPLTTYANGLYILSVNAGDDVFTNKVIIAR